MGVGRVIARPFVGAPGAFTRTANRHDYALDADRRHAARSPDARAACRSSSIGKVDGPVRRPRHHAAPCRPRATPTAWIACSTAHGATTPAGLIFANLVDFDTLYGHRNDVAGLRRQPRAVRRAAGATCCRRLRDDRPAGHHRRSRQRSDDAEHRSLARVRAAAAGRPARAARRRSRHAARRSPISARRSPRTSASGRWRTARASWRTIVVEHS